MIHTIKYRLLLISVIVLSLFISTIFYIEAKKRALLNSIIRESNISLQYVVLNQISSNGIINGPVSNYILPEGEYLNQEIVIQLPKSKNSIINLDFADKISKATGAKVIIIDQNEMLRYKRKINKNPFVNYAFFIFKNLEKQTNNIIFVYKESPQLKDTFLNFRNEYIILTLIILFSAAFLIAGLLTQVVIPITNIIKSFRSQKPENLRKLQNTKSEFGVFANLLKEFFDQRIKLEEEISVRKITQEELETLNDELEKRVEDRTEELAVTNLELQKERDQSKKYLDIAGTIIALLDRDGNIEMINKKGYEALGYQPGELAGKNWYDVCFDEDSNKTYKEFHKDVFEGKTLPVEFLIADIRTKNSEIRTLIFHKTFLQDSSGKYTKLLFSAEDITEIKSKEKQLIEAKEKADEANKAKSAFLANMSHELRTPMIGILGYSELLMNDNEDELQRKMAGAINESGQRLIDTLNLILDLSRLEANKHEVDYQTVNLNELVKSVSFHFEAAALRKGLFIKSSLPSLSVVVKTDPRMIRDVMNNLINNAIKFTNEGGIFITLELFQYFFQISIKDTGIGIAEESINLVFEEFKQLSEGLGRKFQGSGLGLTICKKYVELLGGNISVKSEISKGSEFIFQIPLFSTEHYTFNDLQKNKKAGADNSDKQGNIDNHKETLKHNLLVVEDDVTSRDIIRLFLKDDYNITFAENGETAIECAKKKMCDLIILDINLGTGMNGIEVKNIIRLIKGYEKVPIIAVTAYAMIGDKDKFIAEGFDYYISKPYPRQELLNLIKNSLKHYMLG